MLRDYQQAAVDSAVEWMKKCCDPAIIESPTGSGKSHIASALAEWLHNASKKKVLVLAPNQKLVKQNYQKWLATGNPASIFSASAGEKCTRHNVIFGTPGTVLNSIGRFKQGFAGIIIDEAHGITKSILKIVETMREGNKNIRVIGMSASPYRTGEGYIYRNHYQHGPVREDLRRENPFFDSLIYTIDARILIERGYLAKPNLGHVTEHYDTSGLVKNKMGKWDEKTVDAAFVGRGRLTSQIVADVIDKSRGRLGVMLFAATIQHAKEIMESLPPNLSRIVTGENTQAENDQIIDDFEKMKFKYLVSVEMLTTGFDAPHVSVIAVLRKTESANLITQIIGRGLRPHESKPDCLILDYAENLEFHFPDGDIFAPDIKAYGKGGGSGTLMAHCPMCGGENNFSARKNDDGYIQGDDGYFKDLAGEPITNLDGVPIPSHYGRRCLNFHLVAGRHEQCEYRWSFKECPECGEGNDIAARYCSKCKAEIIDPNERLAIEHAKMASDPYRIRIVPVEAIDIRQWPGKDGKPDTLRVDYSFAESPHTVSEWFSPSAESAWMLNRWFGFAAKAWDESVVTIEDALLRNYEMKCPTEIAFKKKEGSRFWEVKAVTW